MKKVIRLTESDLHRIIKESVNNILTELDWKTYANAAKSRQEQGNDKSSDKLQQYAQQQFNKKHGLNDKGQMFNNNGDDIKFQVGLNQGTVNGREGDENKSSYERYISDEHGMSNGKGYGMHCGYGHGNSKEYYDKLGKASGDMKNYYSKYDKTPYIKGKGWSE